MIHLRLLKPSRSFRSENTEFQPRPLYYKIGEPIVYIYEYITIHIYIYIYILRGIRIRRRASPSDLAVKTFDANKRWKCTCWMKNEMTALQRLIFLLARRGKHLEAFDETDSSLLGYQSFRFVHTLLDYLFGKTSALVCLFQPVILGFSPRDLMTHFMSPDSRRAAGKDKPSTRPDSISAGSAISPP